MLRARRLRRSPSEIEWRTLVHSVARPLDIRAGGGEDEGSYNVNAPVSVDGGTGFDKVVVLGTEFADDIVISVKGIFGAGLNVRYDNIEVVEVDGLEGDDEFFVLSTKFGVAYRVIGGLGSDTINVTGDVVEDIVTRELEGVSGAINHRVSSVLDPLYDGLTVDGIDYNLATPGLGQVVIDDEGPEGTSVREGGSVSVKAIDSSSVRLAANPRRVREQKLSEVREAVAGYRQPGLHASQRPGAGGPNRGRAGGNLGDQSRAVRSGGAGPSGQGRWARGEGGGRHRAREGDRRARPPPGSGGARMADVTKDRPPVV